MNKMLLALPCRSVLVLAFILSFSCAHIARASEGDGRLSLAGLEEFLEHATRGAFSAAWLGDAERSLERYGLSLEMGGVASGSGWGVGLRQTHRPDVRSELGWRFLETYKGYRELELFYHRSLGRSERAALEIGFARRHLAGEDFYGMGLGSRPDDATRFALDEEAVRARLGARLGRSLSLSVQAGFQRFDSRAASESSPSPIDVFAAEEVPGFGARAKYWTVGAALSHDTRDNPYHPRRGRLFWFEAEQGMGIGALSPSYRRFVFEMQSAHPLPGADHSLVARLRLDGKSSPGDAPLPFFLTRGLGGSHSLRSFPRNRFRGDDLALATVEYRHGLMKGHLDAVAFWDMGGVYDGFDGLSLGSLRHSYGVGLRILQKDRIVFRIEVAHGAEGPRAFFSFSTPF